MAGPRRPTSVLLTDAQHTLATSQSGLGKLLGGVTRRTVWRYQGGKTSPYPNHLHNLAKHVHPLDAALAAEIAVAGGATLESLGIVLPPPPQAPVPAAPPAPPPIDPLQARLLVDAIVCAAAEALDVPPKSVRGVLHAAFARAKETGLPVDVIEKALAPKPVGAGKGERRGQ
jgi:hypothetical protein